MSFRHLFLAQLVLCAVLLVPQDAFSQNIYQLKYKTDIPIGVAGVGTLTSSFFLSRKSEPPTPQQIQALNRNNVWKFDRSATYRWSPGSATASDVFMYTSIAMPALLFINKNVRQERYVSLLYVETMALTAGITNLIKELTHRYRPYAYNETVSMEKKTEKDTRLSFFSGHTSLVASSSFFMAKVYADLNPNSNLKPLVWTSAALLPALVGFLRYCAGKHYPTDIIAGYATGAAVGFFVPYIHKKKEFRP